MKTTFTVFLMIVYLALAQAQDPLPLDENDVLQIVLDDASDEIDPSNIAEEFEHLRLHPVNISSAHYGDLLQVPFFSPMLAEELILFRDSVEIISTDQIRSLSLMSSELFDKISPYITAGKAKENSTFIDDVFNTVGYRSRFERKISVQKGYQNGKYLGDRNSVLNRLRIKGRKTDVGAVFEKDAGERYGEGFITGFASINDVGPFRRIIIGNFSVSSQQGLVFAKNIASSKGSNSVGQIKKRSGGISPGLSTDEYRYFQGLASQCAWDKVAVTGFISRRQIHAKIDDSGAISSLFTSGQFKTLNDLKRKNTLREHSVGGFVDFTVGQSASITVNAVHLSYDRDLHPSLYDFEGRRGITAAGVGVQTALVNGEIISEIASNDGRRFSAILGVIIPFSRYVAVAYHHRSFTKGYVNPLARPFGERVNIADGESGNYLGMQVRIGRMVIDSYADLYTFPSTTSLFGRTGTELFTKITIPISKQFQMYVLLRNNTRHQYAGAGGDDERSQTNSRFEYRYVFNRNWTILQRLEINRVIYRPSSQRQRGFLTLCDASYQSQQSSFRFKMRMVFFRSDSYDSRLYQYESDVPGNFSNPPLYGTGIRWYVVSAYEILAGMRLSLKYSETKKLHTNVLGSGDDEISSNIDTAVAVQLDFRM